MKITGTFIDEITHDIPSANWGHAEWTRDFDAMRNVGIDTVIIIRNGYRSSVTFESETIKKYVPIMLPVPFDLVEIFLNEAQRCGMDLFFGTYDSGHYWMQGDYQKEVDINKEFTDEVIAKYGDKPAFKGWYICHEIDAYNDAVMKVYRQLSRHLKSLKDLPILISPYIHGKKQFAENPTTLAQHEKDWDRVFSEISDCVDIVAFQDGNVDYHELTSYLEVNAKLARKHGLISWTNVESFDRDMPIKFPPISWPAFLHKMQCAQQAGVDKMISFEFSHFMSPNSIYPSARNLNARYIEWLKQTNQHNELEISECLLHNPMW